MLICCSRNISDYNQCWKQLCCLMFMWKLWYIFFRIIWWIESSKEHNLFEIEIFCSMNVTFPQFNVFLLNKNAPPPPKKKPCVGCSNINLYIFLFYLILYLSKWHHHSIFQYIAHTYLPFYWSSYSIFKQSTNILAVYFIFFITKNVVWRGVINYNLHWL